MNVHIFVVLIWLGLCLCRKRNSISCSVGYATRAKGWSKQLNAYVSVDRNFERYWEGYRVKNRVKNCVKNGAKNCVKNSAKNCVKNSAKNCVKNCLKNRPTRENRLNSASEGFSNTVHHNVKKNTKNYTEDSPPATYHRYIENLKTRKIIHPSIRITEFDKKFIKCKESYNKLYSHLKNSELFENFQYVGRQKKGILSPKYYLPKYIDRPNYYRTGTPLHIPYEEVNDMMSSCIGEAVNSCKNSEQEEEAESIRQYQSKEEYEPSSDDIHSESSNTLGRERYKYTNIKSEEDIEIIRSNCQFARELMDDVSYIICEGITTNDIDIYILNKCVNNGYYPSPLNYHLFPKSSCISINEILCHGIPDNNVLYENDIVKVDISVFKDGFHADMCESFLVPKLTKNEKKKRKRYYDFIYLNDKFKTRYTKFILKYNYDLIKNKVVKKGKSCSIRRIKYDPPNSKNKQSEHYNNQYDDNTNSVYKNYNYDNTYDYVTKQGNFLSPYDDQTEDKKYFCDLENFHKQYDENVIYNNSQKNQTYYDIQKYIYNNIRGKEKNQKRFEFFDKTKMDINDLKEYMREKNINLMKTAYECTMEAIQVCKPGVPFSAIGDAIDSCLKRKNNAYTNYAVVPHLCGHNIGKNFHEEPFIMHTLNHDHRKMCENLVFTIEPIISERPCDFIMWPDNWTMSNSRYYYSAQFEHTIVIRKHGAEILTCKNDKSPKFIWENGATP
ncbi:methionine aminopeptidase 1c [Plasmodium gonderi]|uniref:Methionine aminopeptidase 1c n=1 Tax=Plasmodium gonderi TaxID=77519 RepID=A0A1Y1JEX1_PLAGO|nr:methionine aminopeptidase 1c [Plasmodium gonderi]GAW78993.1 methionine aminopeptidase 1c [Plasmodium gonderi]